MSGGRAVSSCSIKTKGDHFEHHLGHGLQHLAAFLLTLILLALPCHTVLDLLHTKYQQLRRSGRHTFFDDLRALTRYWVFDTWDHLFDFMIRELELEPPQVEVNVKVTVKLRIAGHAVS